VAAGIRLYMARHWPEGKKCAHKSQFLYRPVKLGDGRIGIKRGQYRNAAEPIRSAGDHGGELIIHDASCLDRKGTIFKELRKDSSHGAGMRT
jgi:hypothetical protein